MVLKLIQAIWGLDYAAFRGVLIAIDVAVACLFFVFASRRMGRWIALAATAPLLFLGAASDSLIWPTMIGVMASLACGLGALLCFEGDRTRSRVAACALLVAAVGFETNGLFFVIAVGIWIVLARRWRELWIPVVPVLLYYAWYATHGSSQFSGEDLAHTPGFFLDSALAAMSGLTGIGFTTEQPKLVGAIAIAVLAAFLAWALARSRPRLGPRTVAIASMPFISWLVIGAGRAADGDPFASRYIYASVLFVLMALVEVLRDTDVRAMLTQRRLAIAVGVALVAVSVGANLELLREAGTETRAIDEGIRGRGAAIELSRRTIDPNLVITPPRDMGNMRAGWYLSLEESRGESPVGAVDVGELSSYGRMSADQVLAAGAYALLTPAEEAAPQGTAPRATVGGGLRRRGSCLVGRPNGAATVILPAGGLLIGARGLARVAIRRYAPSFLGESHWHFEKATALLTAARDYAERPWRVRIATTGRLRLCSTEAEPARLQGPPWPPDGDQGCEPYSLGTPECRFRRYRTRPGMDSQ